MAMSYPCEEEYKKKAEYAEYLTLDEILCVPVWQRFPRPLKIIVKALQHFNSVANFRSIHYRVSKDHSRISINTFKSRFEVDYKDELLIVKLVREKAGGETVVEKAETDIDESFAKEIIGFIADYIKYIDNTPPITIPTKIVKYFLS